MSRNGRRAVFLDRDGTINVEKEYLIDPEQFEFIPGVPEALRTLQNAGFLLIVVTNQSGVARGFFSLEQVHQLHHHIRDKLKEYSVTIDRFYLCPHHPTAGQGSYRRSCDCRKGKPGMLLEAAKDLSIDLKNSFMVGDKIADLEAGMAASCSCILVRTGYGKTYEEEAKSYHVRVVDDLSAATEVIVS